MKREISLKINGDTYNLVVGSGETLVDVLRNRLGFMSVKKGCDIGECGACTVIMDDLPVSSCIVLAIDAADKEIITVEGLSKDGILHPIQQAFIEYGAVQCGFCTPGMILCAYAMLKNNPSPTFEEIQETIGGNLCRCTGYTKIVEAITAVMELDS